jgi:hypothetical protein
VTTRAFGGWLVGIILVALAALAGAQTPPPPLKTITVTGIGEVLTGPSGMVLYVYVNDREVGKSVCTGTCEANWPLHRGDDPAPIPSLRSPPRQVKAVRLQGTLTIARPTRRPAT